MPAAAERISRDKDNKGSAPRIPQIRFATM
jgi:hypothetical protein